MKKTFACKDMSENPLKVEIKSKAPVLGSEWKAILLASPVIYKGKRYAAEIRQEFFMDLSISLCTFSIFEYRDKPRIFKGVRGKRLWSTDANRVRIQTEDGTNRVVDAEEFFLGNVGKAIRNYLPGVVQEMFFAYQKSVTSPCDAEASAYVLKWNGIVSDESEVEK